MEEHQYVCKPCRVAGTVIYPDDDRELCPRLPEHSACPHCGKQMEEVPLGPVEPWPELLELREKHSKPPFVKD